MCLDLVFITFNIVVPFFALFFALFLCASLYDGMMLDATVEGAPPFGVAINLPPGLPTWWMVVVPTLWANHSNAECNYPCLGLVYSSGPIADVSWVLSFGGYSLARNCTEPPTMTAAVLCWFRPRLSQASACLFHGHGPSLLGTGCLHWAQAQPM